MKKILIIIIVLILIIIVWAVIRFVIGGSESAGPVACTADAKLCSDGSYVGRVPPKCDFAACPKEDLIFIETPEPNQVITNPLQIKGKARGFWFFEASFPIVLVDWDGLIIGQGIAQAQGDWMTGNFVEFKAIIEFEKPVYGKNGTLIFQKDNPSGLPKNDDALEMPVLFE